MTVSLAVALIALLIALFALVALVAVYARVRVLEAGRSVEVSGYASLIGAQVPPAVRPASDQRGGIVAVLDAECALCHQVLAGLAEVDDPTLRLVAVADQPQAFTATGPAQLLGDVETRAALFEGYAPTLLAVDATGRVRARSFVYADTDLSALLISYRAELGALSHRTTP